MIELVVFMVMFSDGVEPCSGSMEAAAFEPVCVVDGRQLHLSVPHHDGRHDAHEASAGHLQLQARQVWLLPLCDMVEHFRKYTLR